MTIRVEPHYRLPSTELADWIEKQGIDIWWSVDGDPILMSRIAFPCPGDELAVELRKLNRPLLVEDRQDKPTGSGETITADGLDALVRPLDEGPRFNGTAPHPPHPRVLVLAWEGREEEWLLIEDTETTKESREDAAAFLHKGK